MRSADALSRSSWVAITTMRPASAIDRIVEHTMSTWVWSRCAVGSSASRTGGSDRQRTGDRDPLLLAPREAAGSVVEAMLHPEACQELASRRSGGSVAGARRA